MEMAGESGVGVSINWKWPSDIGLGVFHIVCLSLKLGPIVVGEAREGGVWMSIHWHWASNIWLWVFTSLELSPIIMGEAGECRVWVCIHWHWTSDIWLRIFRFSFFSGNISISLKLSPIIMSKA